MFQLPGESTRPYTGRSRAGRAIAEREYDVMTRCLLARTFDYPRNKHATPAWTCTALCRVPAHSKLAPCRLLLPTSLETTERRTSCCMWRHLVPNWAASSGRPVSCVCQAGRRGLLIKRSDNILLLTDSMRRPESGVIMATTDDSKTRFID